jgi:ferritin-like metal-binding protein YciE
MKLKSFNELLIHELRDLYSAEKQLAKALPKLSKAADSEELSTLLDEHLEETKGQIERLEQIFEELEVSSRGPACKGMKGLIAEGDHLIEEEGDPAVKDAAFISAAQRVEHYEIAGYGSARTFAQQLGLESIAKLLQESLDEEKAADAKLNELAMSHVNVEALATTDSD